MILKKFMKKISRFWQSSMFGDNVYKLNALYYPFLVHKTHDLFKYDKKVGIYFKK